ncbi:MAG: L-lysine 2,3-aminomutase [Chlamydiae bacterium]|nr:L-lysine 2,3-aminomutase [Chlamydiota bacterium]
MSLSPPLWRQIQRKNFTSLEALCSFLEIEPSDSQKLLKKPSFPLNLPLRLAEKITKKNIDDPILLQFVPLLKEKDPSPLFVSDPVGDCQAQQSPKLLQKYSQRVLLITTGACAMHCRYCFRQNYSYEPATTGFTTELEAIRKNRECREVILSGGDPLSLDDRVLAKLIDEIEGIAHVKRLRFHSRFPIGIPERITESFLEILSSSSLQIYFVVHVNHPRELDKEVLSALKKIQKLGIPLLNQSVLLRGVNDSVEVLQELFERLVDHGITPYYLHQLDRVEGAAHFEVAEEKGLELMEELQKRLSGYAIPRYVREVPGHPSKTPLF